MKKHCFIIKLVFLVSLSCNSGESNKINLLESQNVNPIKLQGERILNDEYQAMGLHLVDSILMVALTKSKTHSYRLYNVNDLSIISEFATLGDGPNDWGAPRYGDQVIVKSNGDLQLLIKRWSPTQSKIV